MSSGTSAAAPSRRYSGASKLITEVLASWQCLTSGEGAAQGYAEWRVCEDQLVARADRREHRAPLTDHFVDRLPIRGAHVGDARGDLERGFGIDEYGLTARREISLRRVHEMQHRDIVSGCAQPPNGALDVGDVH